MNCTNLSLSFTGTRQQGHIRIAETKGVVHRAMVMITIIHLKKTLSRLDNQGNGNKGKEK